MADQTNAEVSDERLREIAAMQNGSIGLDETVAMARDLLNCRSVTSQASEGEAEPFNTGVGWENLSCDDQFALARKIASNVGYVLVAEPLISETEDRAEAMMLREALLDADEHLTGIENYGGEPAVRARRGRASIEAALAYASPSKGVERLETADELIGGQSLPHIAELATMLGALKVGQTVTVSSQFHEAAMVLQALQGGR